jgi:ubiquinone/menaquinone biosynthesis C-methylase UbiE
MSNRIIKSVTKIYDTVATYWSQTRKYLWPDILPYLSTLANGDTVLDIGCGNGRLLTGIDKNVKYVGVDNSRKLLDEARKLHPESMFLYGDISRSSVWKKLPLSDAIFCVAVFHHLPWRRNHKFVLDKMYEKLNDGGFVYITVQNFFGDKFGHHHMSFRSMMAKKINWRWLYMPFGEERYMRFMTALGKRYMVNLAKKANFKIEEVYYSNKKDKNVGVRDGYNLVLVLTK